MFIQSSRDRIIDFATKTSNENVPVSREEFNRIFKVYTKYEKYLDKYDMTNGEVDIAYQIIKEPYEQHLRNHSFIEDKAFIHRQSPHVYNTGIKASIVRCRQLISCIICYCYRYSL